MLSQLLHIVLHLDNYLQAFFLHYGTWIYALLFLIIFLESGLILTPFLPGDSLLFAAGTMVAVSALNIHLLALLLIIAAVLGASINYIIGAWIGPHVFNKPKTRWFDPEYIHRAHDFLNVMAGVRLSSRALSQLSELLCPLQRVLREWILKKFIFFNGLAAIIWIGGLLYLSYAFGQLPWVKSHFSWIVLGIVIISVLPVVVAFIRQKIGSRNKANVMD